MLVMNKKGMDRLFTDKFTLGADASIAAGPLGRTVAAQTGAFLTAEILAWSRSRGIFAGIALEGATLRSDKEDNAELYGKPLSNREIIEGNTPVPAPAKPMVNLLDKISPRRQP
jgi:lipid-binding SYLF domain-containing protein